MLIDSLQIIEDRQTAHGILDGSFGTMPELSFQDWFCLRQERRNFDIDPDQDHEYFFGEKKWHEQIESRLQMAEALGVPLRLIWWGQYGIGKTHRLRHTEYLIEKQGYPFRACYLVATDIYENTGFERLHYEMVNSLGRQQLKSLVAGYLLKLRNEEGQMPTLEEICGNSADVASALRSFGGWDNPQLELPAWRFLCGLRLKTSELELANVTKEELSTSLEYASVLRALATIIETETGRQVIFLIDEGEHLTKITNRITVARWQESLRAVLDIRNIGIVLTIGAERMETMPKVVLLPDIVRRFQRDNYVQMEALKLRAVKTFVRGVLSQWIDLKRVTRESAERRLSEMADDFDPKLFPFTASGFHTFCQWAVDDPRNAKPSEILDRLNTVTFAAYKQGLKLLDSNDLHKLGAPRPTDKAGKR